MVSEEVEVVMDVSERLLVKDRGSFGEDGITVRMVDFETSTSGVDSSGKAGSLCSRKSLSSGGVDGGDTECEKWLDEGVTRELPAIVSGSEVTVEIDARTDG